MKNIFRKNIGIKCVIILIPFLVIMFIVMKTTYTRYTPKVLVVGKCDRESTEFWEVAYSGMDVATKTRDMEYTLLAPKDEKEVDRQKELIIEGIEMQPDVMILIASDYDEIADYAKQVSDSGIPLILVDSDVNISYEYKEMFIGTNSKKAGQELGEFAKQDERNGEAIILSHLKGAQTADDREEGIKEGYGEEKIVATYSCDSKIEVAFWQTRKALEEHSEVTTIFGTNEAVTLGAASAIESLGLQGEVQVYGFDGSKQQIQALESGVIQATIIQNPFKMGYLAIESAIALVGGERVKSYIETEFLLITKENMYESGMREFLFPFN